MKMCAVFVFILVHSLQVILSAIVYSLIVPLDDVKMIIIFFTVHIAFDMTSSGCLTNFPLGAIEM